MSRFIDLLLFKSFSPFSSAVPPVPFCSCPPEASPLGEVDGGILARYELLSKSVPHISEVKLDSILNSDLSSSCGSCDYDFDKPVIEDGYLFCPRCSELLADIDTFEPIL